MRIAVCGRGGGYRSSVRAVTTQVVAFVVEMLVVVGGWVVVGFRWSGQPCVSQKVLDDVVQADQVSFQMRWVTQATPGRPNECQDVVDHADQANQA